MACCVHLTSGLGEHTHHKYCICIKSAPIERTKQRHNGLYNQIVVELFSSLAGRLKPSCKWKGLWWSCGENAGAERQSAVNDSNRKIFCIVLWSQDRIVFIWYLIQTNTFFAFTHSYHYIRNTFMFVHKPQFMFTSNIRKIWSLNLQRMLWATTTTTTKTQNKWKFNGWKHLLDDANYLLFYMQISAGVQKKVFPFKADR